MTGGLSLVRHIPSDILCLMAAMPLLLAAGILEQSGNQHTLPEEESYRSNFSEMILDSSSWRTPQQPGVPWRESPRPPVEWRSPASTPPPVNDHTA